MRTRGVSAHAHRQWSTSVTCTTSRHLRPVRTGILRASNCLVLLVETGTKGILVLNPQRLSIGLIGAGRVGAVLAAALGEAGHDIVAVSGCSSASRTRIDTLLPGVRLLSPPEVADVADVVIVAVPDDSLIRVVTELAFDGHLRAGQVVIHTSGRHGTQALAAAAHVGARAVAMHPAMTFTGTDVDLERLVGCVFGLTCGEDERGLAEQLVTDLGGQVMWVAEEQRTLYHAALAHGANHLVTLVSQAMGLLRQAGADDPSAVLRPLLGAALENALVYGDAALTGPVVRGDVATVRGHVEALADAPEPALDTYVAMARATTDLAVADGRLNTEQAQQVRGALAEAEWNTLAAMLSGPADDSHQGTRA